MSKLVRNPTDDQLETAYLSVSIMAVIEEEIDKIVDAKIKKEKPSSLGKKIACSWCEKSMKFRHARWDKNQPLCHECYDSAFWNHGDEMPFTESMEFEDIPMDTPLPSEGMDPHSRIKNMSCERCYGPIMSSSHAHWFGNYPTCRACYDLSILWNGAEDGLRPYTKHEEEICDLMDRMIQLVEGMSLKAIQDGEMEKILMEMYWFKENRWHLMICHNAIHMAPNKHPHCEVILHRLKVWYERVAIFP